MATLHQCAPSCLGIWYSEYCRGIFREFLDRFRFVSLAEARFLVPHKAPKQILKAIIYNAGSGRVGSKLTKMR